MYPELARHIRERRTELAREWYEAQFSAPILSQFPNEYATKAERSTVVERHMLPMLDLLAEYARTGDSAYLDLYLAERKRYAPHRDGLDTLRKYFSIVVAAHEEALTRTMPAKLRDIISQVHASLTRPLATRVRMLVIGDCLMTNVTGFLQSSGAREGIEFDFRSHYLSARMGTSLAEDGVTAAIREGVDLIAVSYLSYEGIPLYRLILSCADRGARGQLPKLAEGIGRYLREHLMRIRELTDAPILLHNTCGLPLTRWRQLPFLRPLSTHRRDALRLMNAAIAELRGQVENCILIDEAAIVERHGIRQCARRILPRRMWKQAQLHPEYLSRYLADRYMEVVRDWVLLRKCKLLLVDFDNTLWDGVMAEGAVRHFTDKQRLLKRLSEQGIVLAAVSKNDPANIRWGEMQLSESDFASLKISWNLKVQSIREIAAELNLGLDSFVLLDDNPTELGIVQAELPGVVCLDAREASTWRTLELLFSMPNTRQTGEARKRTQMYREQSSRQAMTRGQDGPALMAMLELRSAVGPARPKDRDRLLELVTRTNQFNTTTIRYSKTELEAAMSDPHSLVLVGDLSDKFGDFGLVCAAIVRHGGTEAIIENFVMSCRAMGFGMEQLMLSQIQRRSGRPLVGKYVRSDRNEPASTLFSLAGFVEGPPGTWRLPAGISLESPAWITLSARD